MFKINKYKKYLTDDILSFWIKNSFDKEYEGLSTFIDSEGNLKENNKSVLFIGRSLWTFANAYNKIEAKKEYLDACESLYNFYSKCILPDGRLPFLVKRNGEVIEKRESFHVEGFACMGCASFYKATKREDVKKKALDFFEIVLRVYNEKKTTTLLKDGILHNIFGAEMMLINICQFMRSSGIEDSRFNELIDEAIENIKNYGFIDDKNKRMREYAPADCKNAVIGENEYVCFGHLYEAAWFIMSEGVFRGDMKLCHLGRKIMDYAICMEKDFCPLRTSNTGFEYAWWPQCEAMCAFSLCYNIYKDKKYKENFEKLFDFSTDCFADKEKGEWFMTCTKEGRVINTDKGGLFKGPFHLPRLFMVLSILEDNGSILNYIS